MRVADLARHPLAVLEVDHTLLDAAREMDDNGLSAVIVNESGQMVGIITLRDVVRAAAEGAPLDTTPVEDYMTGDPITLGEDTTAQRALDAMLRGSFRHVPILDDDGEPVGILSMRDLAAAKLLVLRT